MPEKEETKSVNPDAQVDPDKDTERLSSESDPAALYSALEAARKEAASRRVENKKIKVAHEELQGQFTEMQTKLDELAGKETEREKALREAAEAKARDEGNWQTLIDGRDRDLQEREKLIADMQKQIEAMTGQTEALTSKLGGYVAARKREWETTKAALAEVDEKLISTFGIYMDDELTEEQINHNLIEIVKMRGAGLLGGQIETKGVQTVPGKGARTGALPTITKKPGEPGYAQEAKAVLEALADKQ
jgi:chromosome segregation ATPase